LALHTPLPPLVAEDNNNSCTSYFHLTCHQRWQCFVSATSDDFLDVVSKFVQVGAVTLLLLLLIILAVAANDIGGNDKGEKASTSVVVKSDNDDMS
jgi:DMSO/TMAO reductase YedYZ heme-binding membrane subunit